MATTTKTVAPEKTRGDATPAPKRHRKRMDHQYPYWFYLPAAIIYGVLFLVPTFASFYFSLTRWSLFDTEFIGFDNFVAFFQEDALVKGLTNTLIYGVVTSGLKVVLADAPRGAAHLADHSPAATCARWCSSRCS